MLVAQSFPYQSSIVKFHNFGFKMIKRCPLFSVLDRALQYIIKIGVIDFHLRFLSPLHSPFTDEEFLDVHVCNSFPPQHYGR